METVLSEHSNSLPRVDKTYVKIGGFSLAEQKIREIGRQFPELVATLCRNPVQQETVLAFRTYLGSGPNASQRFEAVKDNVRVISVLPRNLLEDYSRREALSQGLILAAETAKTLREVTEQLGQKDVWIDAADNRGRTALHVASKRYDIKITKLLLERGANPHTVDRRGRTALHSAIRKGNLQMAKVLLENGADPNAVDESGRTALWLAVRDADLEMAELLLEMGADPNRVNKWDRSPLVQAAEWEDLELMELLLRTGANPDVADEFGLTLLHKMAAENKVSMAKLLLVGGCNSSITGSVDETPLCVAAAAGNLEIAQLIINDNVNDNDGLDKALSAAYGACAFSEIGQAWRLLDNDSTNLGKYSKMIQLLIDSGADIRRMFPDSKLENDNVVQGLELFRKKWGSKA